MAKLSIIAAVSAKDNGIGKNGDLLWNIKEDLKHFKNITMGHPIIMGRKTYKSIGKPLPGRANIVITRNEDFNPPGVVTVRSIDEAIEKAKLLDQDEVFIIGGGQIYEQSIDQADKLYLTIIESEKEADTFFPEYDQFKKEISREEGSSEGIGYTFLELERS